MSDRHSSPVYSGEKRHRILIMDDDDMIREAAGRILINFGYEVDFSTNGAEALACYRRALENGRPFDAIIIDLTVPGGMGGGETIKKLRELDPDVKAIVSSGYSGDPVIIHYREHGFSGFVTKPFSVKTLCDAVRGVLRDDSSL